MQFDEFIKILDLLKEPAKYEAQMKMLKDQQDSIQESIKQLGVVGNIVTAKKKADNLTEIAEKKLADAQVEAEKIISTAQKSFDERYADLVKREAAADEAMTTFRNHKMTWGARAEEHRAKEQQLHSMEKGLLAGQAELAKRQAEVDERLAKLRQVMG